VTRRAPAALAAGALAYVGERLLREVVAARPRWTRSNFRGRSVQLSAGPAVAGAAISAIAFTSGSGGAVLAGGTAAALGLYDDLYGDTHARGLRGHLRALRERRLTTGLVKLGGLATAGFIAGHRHRGRALPALADAAVIAGSANLVNLFDLRPGRALKVAGAVAVVAAPLPGTAGVVASATAAAAGATLPADLGESVMIGDCGANAIGALLGWSLATGLGRVGRTAALAGIVGLTLASERVSFSAVIERNRWLRECDEWGRR
jgi:UDP-GlcNAc:undecaprenyl-phosphate GlcNAc-1-phosphate transferase